MRFPWNKSTGLLLESKPTVGQLMDLCEENYRLLLAIAPDLPVMDGKHHSITSGAQDLFLEVLDQSRYTTQVHLTYYFPHENDHKPDPDATLRVYHDAAQLEVIDIRQQALPVANNYFSPGLWDKWKANVFVSKWLEYCRTQGHDFSMPSQVS